MMLRSALTLRRLWLAGSIFVAILGASESILAQTAAAAGSATPPAAASTPAASVGATPAADAVAEVKGFRSALFGMAEADVRAAAAKDFAISPDAIKSGQNAIEHTQVLTLKAADVLPEGGSAEVAYVLGYKTKKLIQVNISWSKATDDKLTPERLTANAETLRAYFLGAGYKADTIVNNAPMNNGVLLFRGADSSGRTTALLLQGSFTGDKEQRTLSPTNVNLFYLADAKNPDIYRVQPGKF
ncbi:hypothetical protein [Methylocapsa sp. S129]|uniref:hypothetical protein n=1 Tax=Methylocapsa sp. S129 TaxID=1641869 RepID=UPI00131BF4E5|nr:hypothetical protein [Methylocapsa sp. S129]